jgi:DNA-directed RNA polymerase specialized sigma24 family protein
LSKEVLSWPNPTPTPFLQYPIPADYQEVIVLRNLQELPHEEVARRMGRSIGAVRMLWVRALAQLRAELPDSGTARSAPRSV